MSNNKINQMVDIFDECAMLYFENTVDQEKENTDVSNYKTEKLHSNFYECLIKIVRFFLDENEPLEIHDEDIIKQINDKLNTLEEIVNNTGYSKEEVRQALLLLDIKGFKNLNFDLDLITPDAISLIMTMIISGIYNKPNQELNIYDPNIGTGNLVFHLASNLDNDVKILGMDSHSLMARVTAMKSDLLQIPSDIYFDDALSMIPTDVDLIVSDIACYDYENPELVTELTKENIKYFPYLLIGNLLQIKKPTIGYYLINNDFFNQAGSNIFKQYLNEHGEVLSLITLPQEFFKDVNNQKAIIIISNQKKHQELNCNIYHLPSLSKHDEFLKTIKDIQNQIKNYLNIK